MCTSVVLSFFPYFLGTIYRYLYSKWVLAKVWSPVLEEGSHYSVSLHGSDHFRPQGCDAVPNLRSVLEYGVSPHFMSQIQSFHPSNRTPDRMLQDGTWEMVLVDEGLAVHIGVQMPAPTQKPCKMAHVCHLSPRDRQISGCLLMPQVL